MSTKNWAEQATGIREGRNGIGTMYADGGDPLTPTEAYDALCEGDAVEVPNAGAGSYNDVFEAIGFTQVKDVETGSSAGDWTLAVKDGEGGDWFVAYQTNRYPYFGFSYAVNFECGFETFEELCNCIG